MSRIGTLGSSLYLFATLAVALFLWARRGSQSYVAHSALPANHRLVSSDLVVPRDIEGTARELALPDHVELVGRYLSRAVPAGGPIERGDVAGRPSLAAAMGMATVAVRIPQHLAEGHFVDAGSSVDVAADGERVAGGARVVGISCADQTCVAFLEVPRSSAFAVAGIKGEAILILADGTSGGSMDKRQWAPLAKIYVAPVPDGLWTLAHEFVPSGAILQLNAQGTWTYRTAAASPLTCGPDGRPDDPQTDLLMADAPVGAMIAKIGGSTAGKTDGELFVVGASSVIMADPKKHGGPLYLTMNVNPASRPAATKEKITVEISEARP